MESVRGYPLLWNSGSGDYKDRNVKANAWEAVAKENSCTVEEAKKYWKNLRDKFVRERKQEDDSKRSGGSADSVYVSKWVHFKVLSFLADTIKHRATASNLPSGGNRSGDDSDSEDDSGGQLSENSDLIPVEREVTMIDDSETGQVDSVATAAETGRPEQRKTQKGRLSSVLLESSGASWDSGDDVMPMTEKDAEEDRRRRSIRGAASSRKRRSADTFEDCGIELVKAAKTIVNRPSVPPPSTVQAVDPFALEVSAALHRLEPNNSCYRVRA